MKYLFLSCFAVMYLLNPSLLSSQTVISYTEVVNVDNVSQKELYDNAKLFLERITSNIEESHETFTLKAEIKKEFTHDLSPIKNQHYGGNKNYTHTVIFDITIQTREGRYKYEIPKVVHEKGVTKAGTLNVKQNSFRYGELISANVPIKDFEKKASKINKEYVYVKEYLIEELNIFIDDLKKEMIKKVVIGDDW